MSSKGVADIVFCIDASASMRPCLDGVRQHVLSFIEGLQSGQRHVDWRIDFVAHSCDESGTTHREQSTRCRGTMELIPCLYGQGGHDRLFTRDLDEFRAALQAVETAGDEATLVGLDFALDFPWRPRSQCHRVVICLTDEPFESGAGRDLQKAQLPALLTKIQKLGVLLFLVAPESEVYEEVGAVQRSEYHKVASVSDGLRGVDFGAVLGALGKSVSATRIQAGVDSAIPRGLFGQPGWVASSTALGGR